MILPQLSAHVCASFEARKVVVIPMRLARRTSGHQVRRRHTNPVLPIKADAVAAA
jgi:hypothetical protein